MEAVAKHEFNATADDELSFKRNQVLKVIRVNFCNCFKQSMLTRITNKQISNLYADSEYGG